MACEICGSNKDAIRVIGYRSQDGSGKIVPMREVPFPWEHNRIVSCCEVAKQIASKGREEDCLYDLYVVMAEELGKAAGYKPLQIGRSIKVKDVEGIIPLPMASTTQRQTIRLETSDGELVRLAYWDSFSGDVPSCLCWPEADRYFLLQHHKYRNMLVYSEIVKEVACRNHVPHDLPSD